MRWFGALFLVSILAGCLDPATTKPSTPDSYAYECPSAERIWNSPIVCVGTLAAGGIATGEPNLAVSRRDARFLAMGVNIQRVNNTTTTAGVPPLHPLLVQPGTAHRTPLFVSSDAGATWNGLIVPRPSGSYGADASILIDPSDVIHFSGLNAVNQSGAFVGGLYYVNTPDRGATWSSPVQISLGETADRNWLSRSSNGTLFLTWQTSKPATATQLAVSADNGGTWTRPLGKDEIPGCNLQTRVVETKGGLFLACLQRGSDGTWVAVLRIDLARGEATRVRTLPSASGTLQLAVTRDSRLILSYPAWVGGRPDVVVRTGSADGTIWGDPMHVRSLATLEDDWNWTWLSEAEPDPWGNHHLLLVGGAGDSCFNASCRDGAQRRRTLHVVLDPDRARLVQEAQLTPSDPTSRPRPEGTSAFYYFEEFHSVVFDETNRTGLIAWGHDRYVDYTRIRAAQVLIPGHES